MGLVPETVDEYAILNKSLWTNDHIRPAIVEMVRLRNARTVNCVFCKSVRYDVAKADGLSEDKVDNIADGFEKQRPDRCREDRAGLHRRLSVRPEGVTPALTARLKATFSEAEIATLAVRLPPLTPRRAAPSPGRHAREPAGDGDSPFPNKSPRTGEINTYWEDILGRLEGKVAFLAGASSGIGRRR